MEIDDDVDIHESDSKGGSFLDEYNRGNENNEGNSEDGDDDDDDNCGKAEFLIGRFSPSKTKTTTRRRRRNGDPGYGIFFRTHHVLIMMVAVATMFAIVVVWGRSRKPELRFRLQTNDDSYSHPHYSAQNFSNRTFKIMQITDIHLGEAEFTDWGPKQDEKTFALLEKIFEYEPDCDLIVLGGDQLTANNCLGNCTAYYGILGRFLSGFGVPWAMILGNHDDMAFEVEDGTGATIPHEYSRRDLLRADRKFPLSLSSGSEAGRVSGVTNYVLDVLDPLRDEPALQIFFLDSGGGSLREAINDDQIRWFREQTGVSTAAAAAAADDTSQTTKTPAVAFQHIPTWHHEYNADGSCLGYRGEGVAELEYDAGIVDAMIESRRFHFLAVGHNHGNDYCCRYIDGGDENVDKNETDYDSSKDLYFCFGRHSGYGGYGKWDRGVRIYELLLTPDGESNGDSGNRGSDIPKNFKWRTWVSLIQADVCCVLACVRIHAKPSLKRGKYL